MSLLKLVVLLLGVATLSVGCEERASTPTPVPAPIETTNVAPPQVNVVPAAPPPAPAEDDQANSSIADLGAGARPDTWVEPADRAAFALDFQFTDQEGREVNFNDFVGKPMAVTFFFTRCPNPEMCPVIITRLAQLEAMVRKAGMTDDVNLLAISYDPTHDTPAVMKAYGSQRGMRFDGSAMLRPTNDQYLALLRELEVNITVSPNGTIGHFVEMILIDSQGRYARDYRGDVWPNEPVFADLKRLVAEAAAPADQAVAPDSSPSSQPD